MTDMTGLSGCAEGLFAAAAESPHAEESRLVRCAEESAALEQLYIKYKADVYAFSLSLFNNRTIAEDCVQETFIRLPAAASGYRNGCSEAAFILGIAKNVSRELYRSEMRFRAGAADIEVNTPLSAASQSGVLEAVRELPKKFRTVLTLKIYSELTFKEISALLRIPESTLKSRYKRALAMLAARLEPDGTPKAAAAHTYYNERGVKL